MSTRTASLSIDVRADVADAARDLAEVGDAALRMGDEVDRGAQKADTAAGRLDRVGESADNLDDKAGRATGALGALSSGFELVGAEKYATGLQGAALATDFFSGVGQAGTLILESKRLATIKATVATKAQAVATKTATVAQKGLNIAMRANPLGLVIASLLIVVGAFTLAYRRSETFRRIVDGVMSRVKDAIQGPIQKLSDLKDWVQDKVPPAWEKLKEKGKAAINALIEPIRKVIGWVQDLIDKIERGIERIQSLIGKIGDAGKAASEGKGLGFLGGNRSPFSGRSSAVPSVAGSAPVSTTIDARTYVDLGSGGDLVDVDTLVRLLADLLRRNAIRIGDLVPGAKVTVA